jgi:hypothetical protein
MLHSLKKTSWTYMPSERENKYDEILCTKAAAI